VLERQLVRQLEEQKELLEAQRRDLIGQVHPLCTLTP